MVGMGVPVLVLTRGRGVLLYSDLTGVHPPPLAHTGVPLSLPYPHLGKDLGPETSKQGTPSLPPQRTYKQSENITFPRNSYSGGNEMHRPDSFK